VRGFLLGHVARDLGCKLIDPPGIEFTVQSTCDVHSFAMPRSNIEIYWNGVDSAPAEVPLQVLVNDGSGADYLLPYPCKRTPDGWVSAATGARLQVRPTYWKLHVETPPGKKGRTPKKAPTLQS
jgi:hypothetical protein